MSMVSIILKITYLSSSSSCWINHTCSIVVLSSTITYPALLHDCNVLFNDFCRQFLNQNVKFTATRNKASAILQQNNSIWNRFSPMRNYCNSLWNYSCSKGNIYHSKGNHAPAQWNNTSATWNYIAATTLDIYSMWNISRSIWNNVLV